jgi:hypothetical protein
MNCTLPNHQVRIAELPVLHCQLANSTSSFADCPNALQTAQNFKKLQAAECLKFIPFLPKLLPQKENHPIFRLLNEGVKHLFYFGGVGGRRGMNSYWAAYKVFILGSVKSISAVCKMKSMWTWQSGKMKVDLAFLAK